MPTSSAARPPRCCSARWAAPAFMTVAACATGAAAESSARAPCPRPSPRPAAPHSPHVLHMPERSGPDYRLRKLCLGSAAAWNQGGSRRHHLQWTAAPPLHRQAARALHQASAWTACPASCGRESDGLGRWRRVDTQLATRGPPRPAPAATPCMRTGACHAFCFTGPLHPERKVGPALHVAVRSWSRELLVERECGQRVRAVQGTTQFHSPTSTERAPGTAVTSRVDLRGRPCALW